MSRRHESREMVGPRAMSFSAARRAFVVTIIRYTVLVVVSPVLVAVTRTHAARHVKATIAAVVETFPAFPRNKLLPLPRIVVKAESLLLFGQHVRAMGNELNVLRIAGTISGIRPGWAEIAQFHRLLELDLDFSIVTHRVTPSDRLVDAHL